MSILHSQFAVYEEAAHLCGCSQTSSYVYIPSFIISKEEHQLSMQNVKMTPPLINNLWHYLFSFKEFLSKPRHSILRILHNVTIYHCQAPHQTLTAVTAKLHLTSLQIFNKQSLCGVYLVPNHLRLRSKLKTVHLLSGVSVMLTSALWALKLFYPVTIFPDIESITCEDCPCYALHLDL